MREMLRGNLIGRSTPAARHAASANGLSGIAGSYIAPESSPVRVRLRARLRAALHAGRVTLVPRMIVTPDQRLRVFVSSTWGSSRGSDAPLGARSSGCSSPPCCSSSRPSAPSTQSVPGLSRAEPRLPRHLLAELRLGFPGRRHLRAGGRVCVSHRLRGCSTSRSRRLSGTGPRRGYRALEQEAVSSYKTFAVPRGARAIWWAAT